VVEEDCSRALRRELRVWWEVFGGVMKREIFKVDWEVVFRLVFNSVDSITVRLSFFMLDFGTLAMIA
jgi:hypothetical protein